MSGYYFAPLWLWAGEELTAQARIPVQAHAVWRNKNRG